MYLQPCTIGFKGKGRETQFSRAVPSAHYFSGPEFSARISFTSASSSTSASTRLLPHLVPVKKGFPGRPMESTKKKSAPQTPPIGRP